MAESSVETLRSAAADLRSDFPQHAHNMVAPAMALPLADWLDRETDAYEINESTCLTEALAVARVLLGVPDA